MNMLKFATTAVRYLGVVSLLFTLSCIKEDLSECDYYLQFRYDYNLATEDWFAAQVEEVKVYLFDKQGGYVQTLTDTIPAIAQRGYKMKIPYKMKGYTAVVWAGRTDSYQLPSLTIGDSKDKLKLLYMPNENRSDTQIDNLWHCGPATLFFPDNGGTTQSLSLVRNTNDFLIRFTHSDGVSIPPHHHMKITSANGSYDHVNNFLPDNPPIDYVPHTIESEETQLRTLRLIEGDNILLSVTDNDGNSIDINGNSEINLIEYLLLGKPSDMINQEYLDRRYIWNISLTVKDNLVLNIIINGWIVWFDNTEI